MLLRNKLYKREFFTENKSMARNSDWNINSKRYPLIRV